MCGRFVQSSAAGILGRSLGAKLEQTDFPPRFNVAPSQRALVLREARGKLRFDLLRWGLIPSWAKGFRALINARSETAARKPAFRGALASRRCLVPADGFYEWKTVPGSRRKQPYYIHAPDGEALALAGLWERSRLEGDSTVETFTILTRDATPPIAEIHSRMPLILPREECSAWLGAGPVDGPALGQLAALPLPEPLRVHPVRPLVNDVTQEGPALIEAVRLDEPQKGLFD